jgi:hypothetical protein
MKNRATKWPHSEQHEKQVRENMRNYVFRTIVFKHSRMARMKKNYTLFVPAVSSLKAHEQWGEKKTHKTSFFRTEVKVNCEGRRRACECRCKWELKVHSSACLRTTPWICVCGQELKLREILNSTTSGERIYVIYLTKEEVYIWVWT